MYTKTKYVNGCGVHDSLWDRCLKGETILARKKKDVGQNTDQLRSKGFYRTVQFPLLLGLIERGFTVPARKGKK